MTRRAADPALAALPRRMPAERGAPLYRRVHRVLGVVRLAGRRVSDTLE